MHSLKRPWRNRPKLCAKSRWLDEARSSFAKAFIFAATSLGRHARLPLSTSVFFIDSAAWLASSQVWQR
jgi:hypothetical protein